MHRISKHVKAYYDRLHADQASVSSGIPIQQGRDLAEHLQYPMDLLDDLPLHAWESFLPCGNPLIHLRPMAGERILNLGSGIGIDSLALVRLFDFSFRIVNFDVVRGVLAKSKTLVSELTSTGGEPLTKSLSWVCGEGESLPFGQGVFDWVLMNGAFNLFPDKLRLLNEVRNTLRTHGRLLVTDLCAATALPDYFREELDAWAWCMGGACSKTHLKEILESSGFRLTLLDEEQASEMLFPIAFIAQKTG